jgi:UDP-GlcNAc:undecaprenyl-phosphate GlcNAc-1-phosphate transferase
MNFITYRPLLTSALAAFLLSYFLIRLGVPMAKKFGLVDRPDDRKQHVGNVPVIGGIAVAMGACIALILSQKLVAISTLTIYIFVGSTMMLILGIIDDLYQCSWRWRLLFQVVISVIVLKVTGLNIHDILGFDLTSVPGLSLGFTLLAIVGMTNAINLLDGIDGLAGGITLIAIANIFLFSSPPISLIGGAHLVILAAGLLAFLYANILGGGKIKVFLGDSGSYMLGFMIALSLINFSEGANPTLSHSSVLWCVAIPILDTAGVMLRRLADGHSPFYPDHRHLHHLLIKRGMSPKAALLSILCFASILSVSGMIIEHHLPKWSLPIFVLLALAYVSITWRQFGPSRPMLPISSKDIKDM